jgi:hypothetical protein
VGVSVGVGVGVFVGVSVGVGVGVFVGVSVGVGVGVFVGVSVGIGVGVFVGVSVGVGIGVGVMAVDTRACMESCEIINEEVSTASKSFRFSEFRVFKSASFHLGSSLPLIWTCIALPC